MSQEIAYARGRDKFDASPEQRTARDFAAFRESILADRSPSKGLSWISAPFRANGDGRHHRCREGVLLRLFIAFDLDGATPEGFVELCLLLAAYSGFGYTTASHTAENPHARFVVELSRLASREECIRLGQAMQRLIEDRLGPGAVKLDPAVYRGEQPIYGPLFGADTMRYDGDPIDVDRVLRDAPPLKESPGRAERATSAASADPVVRTLTERGMVRKDHGDGKISITCPFEGEHTEQGGESSTCYFLPHFGGVKYGKFSCLHAHCSERKQEDFLRELGLDPRQVWREQTRAAAPYDDLPPGPAAGAAPGEYAWSNGEERQVPSYPEIPPLDVLRINLDEFDAARLTPQPVVESYVYSDVALMPGPGGTGKTTLFLFEAVHIALGKPLYGLQVHTPGAVVLVTAEDRRELLIARLRRIMEALKLSAEEWAKVCARVMIWDVTGTVCRLTELDRHGNVVLTGLADAIVECFRETSPVVVGLDPVISFGAGERIVNDNEHSLILAARRIVRGLGCCVRLICHTGKQGARDGAIDQYAARGGSALADGARMVAVLRSWNPEAADDKLIPPQGLSLGPDEQAIVLARPKLSYDPPQPLIWLKRRGYAFEHFIATRPNPEAEAKARADQVHCYLIDQLADGSRHTKKTLEDTGVMPQAKLRAALASLMAAGRVIYAELPEELRHGGRKDYLHPVTPTSSAAEAKHDEVGQKSASTSSAAEASPTSSLPYREFAGDEVEVTGFSHRPYHLVNERQRGSNEVDEVDEVGTPNATPEPSAGSKVEVEL